MKILFKRALWLLVIALPLYAQIPDIQTWTASDGRVLQANFIRLDGEVVVVEKSGSIITLPLSRLNAQSVEQAQKMGAKPGAAVKPAEALGMPTPKRMTPDFLKGFTNSLGMKFVPVRGTNVLFCIHETRRKDYAAYALVEPGVNGLWKSAAYRKGGVTVSAGDQDDHPVCELNFRDAQAFCEWLSKEEGLNYRLPTGKEWCEAAGIGDLVKFTKNGLIENIPNLEKKDHPFFYPWGRVWPPPNGFGNYADTSFAAKFPGEKSLAGYTDGFVTTAPVMSFKPNKYGIYDLGGNVSEWCDECHASDIAKTKTGVIRGEAFCGATEQRCRSAEPNYLPLIERYVVSGFRIVVEKTR